jgi:hypothetical protein
MPWREVSVMDQRREFVRLAMQESGSCPYAWCSFLMVTTIAGHGRACQVATAGNPTMGLSLMGAMVSSVM